MKLKQEEKAGMEKFRATSTVEPRSTVHFLVAQFNVITFLIVFAPSQDVVRNREKVY